MRALCSKCFNEPRRPGQRYGRKCHAESMKKYRKVAGDRLKLMAQMLHVEQRSTLTA